MGAGRQALDEAFGTPGRVSVGQLVRQAGTWCLRGLGLATIGCLGLALFVLGLVSVLLIPAAGVGVVLTPVAMGAVRDLTTWQRRLIGDWLGVRIELPYHEPPAWSDNALLAAWQRCLWALRNASTWRDMAWLLVGFPAGLVLGLLPAMMVVYGLEGVLLGFILGIAVPGFGYGVFWPITNVVQALLAPPQGVLLLVGGALLAPLLLTVYGRFAKVLLAPTYGASMALRVRHLTDTRSAAVDTQAAELRRIERDLHDGAQARLVALSISLGMAADLLARDPDAAQQLLNEARETSDHAQADLRNLVRGIHPPVLAERGLAGAVQALALALPTEVTVQVDLPGRPPAPVESAAYFAIAEALANVVKHSGAAQATVTVTYADGSLTLVVIDDGVGGASLDGGTGLAGVRRRLEAFDGTLTVISPAGGPTAVMMTLPSAVS
ncbi:histidine kinase [Micromonospora sp. CPCC 205711]|uniref:sensor histidine kinase n=1 Tax=Micromonospora sp. CPCC 205547 TaxID=3122400 RepID=UPI002FEEBFC2